MQIRLTSHTNYVNLLVTHCDDWHDIKIPLYIPIICARILYTRLTAVIIIKSRSLAVTYRLSGARVRGKNDDYNIMSTILRIEGVSLARRVRGERVTEIAKMLLGNYIIYTVKIILYCYNIYLHCVCDLLVIFAIYKQLTLKITINIILTVFKLSLQQLLWL